MNFGFDRLTNRPILINQQKKKIYQTSLEFLFSEMFNTNPKSKQDNFPIILVFNKQISLEKRNGE